jgi:anthranilate synthase component 1
LHPFNVYRNLRNVNPSPYLFFVDCDDFQIVGASPELLVKEEQGRIITHPIAGTVKRGKTLQEDAALAEELSNSLKDRAEHVGSLTTKCMQRRWKLTLCFAGHVGRPGSQ